MTGHSARPSLMSVLAQEAIETITEKGLFGRRYVRFGPFVVVGLWVYQTGAILGRACHDRLEILSKMCGEAECEPEWEEAFCDFLRGFAGHRVERYGREPDSFVDFVTTTEYQQAGLSLPLVSLSAMKQAQDRKMPLDWARAKAEMYVLEGIGFGARYPDLTERMWKKTYETPDFEARAGAQRYGVDVSQEPSVPPMHEREQQVLAQVAWYATEHFPELVEPLGLHLT